MITLQDLIQNDTTSLKQYFDIIVANYLANVSGSRKKALRMYELSDEEQKQEFNEYLINLGYSLGVELKEFLEDNVKA